MANPDSWAVALGCTMEAYRAGAAQGVQLTFADPLAYVTEFAATIPNTSPSMRLDHLARRPSEIDVINGQVVELSRQLGLEAPYNETLCAIVRRGSPSSDLRSPHTEVDASPYGCWWLSRSEGGGGIPL